MNFKTVLPDKSISLFVKIIMIFEEPDGAQKTILPFFADGYPGLIFQETENGLLVSPHNKLMPSFFLYGQTIKPIELILNGSYRLIIFQLYPFVLKNFFDVVPKDLNDNCYDLAEMNDPMGSGTLKLLKESVETNSQIEIIHSFLNTIFQNKKQSLDYAMSEAIRKIIDHKGQLIIGDLCNELNLTERTFERRFFSAVGVTAKQFAKIIQFQESLLQLTVKDYTKLTDIVFANGYADQSHFIKVFKAFTGKTPMTFSNQK